MEGGFALSFAVLLCSLLGGCDVSLGGPAGGAQERSPAPTHPAPPPEPPPMPLEVSVELEGGVAKTGRLALFTVRAQGGPGGLVRLEGRFLGKPVITAPFDGEGRLYKVLAAVPIEGRPGEGELWLSGALADESPVVLSRRFNVEEAPYESSQITVSRRFMRPSKKDRRRGAREQQRLREVLARPAEERLWRGSFVRPTDTRQTSPFGTLRTYNNKKRSRHLGLDLDGDIGHPIRAAQRGRAVLVEDRFYSGGTVVLDHGQGLYTMYFHMSAFDVKEGDLAEKGQLIGKVGKSGRVTGPHLHFSVKLAGEYVDPEHVLALDLSGDPQDTSATLPFAAKP